MSIDKIILMTSVIWISLHLFISALIMDGLRSLRAMLIICVVGIVIFRESIFAFCSVYIGRNNEIEYSFYMLIVSWILAVNLKN
jgi:hypothetical protein